MHITEAKVIAQVDWGIKYWEVHLYGNRTLKKIVNIPLETTRRLGITKRLNGIKKLESWMNSEEGLKLLSQVKGKWFTGKEVEGK